MRLAMKFIAATAVFAIFSSAGSAESPHLYGLIQTSGFNELLDYDLGQDPFTSGGYQPSSLAPLDFTNLLPQNSITSIALSPSTFYGLVRTSGFNELLTYDRSQDPFTSGGYQPSSLAPLDFTNLLPQNGITSIAVSGNTLYGLIRTDSFNELLTYDLTQDPFTSGGYQPSSLAPLDFTNLLPQNGITSIAVSGDTLYGLIQTDGFNELLTYDLTQDPFTSGGYQPSSLAPLDFTNLLPQNSIIGIAVDPPAAIAAVPEPASWATMILGLALAGFGLRRARSSVPRGSAAMSF